MVLRRTLLASLVACSALTIALSSGDPVAAQVDALGYGVLRDVTYRENDNVTRVVVFARPDGTRVVRRWLWRDGTLRSYTQGAPHKLPNTWRERYRTKNEFYLPFPPTPHGRWYVFWGGREAYENYHVDPPSEANHYAVDFIVVRGVRSFSGSGKSNADYFCWGAPVTAPAAGRVISVQDGHPDSVPGTPNRRTPANQVYIDHGAGERSRILHFRKGTVAVKAGQAVRTGQYLGQCGSSGYSFQPHVHMQLEVQADGVWLGVPIAFERRTLDGRYAPPLEPRRGQLLFR